MSSLVAYDSSDDENDSKDPNGNHQGSESLIRDENDVPVKVDRKAPSEIVNETAPLEVPGPAMPRVQKGDVDEDDDYKAPLSYSMRREIIQSLTLPPMANTAVPPSPPGSPEPSTSAKIKHFLGLKSQGFHFNAKLATSSALQNPSLIRNLMDFAGIDLQQGQYCSTLPDSCSPIPEGGFLKDGYVEELNSSQQKISKRKESERRDNIDFIPSGSK